MQIFINRVTRRLQRSVTDTREVTQLDFKRGDAAVIELFFVQDLAVVELAADTAIRFGAKERLKFDGTAVVFSDAFTKTGTGTSTKYSATPSFNTEPLDDLLVVDDDDANDLPLVDLGGEISWQAPADDLPTTTDDFIVRVKNDYLRGEEATPSELPDPTAWTKAPLYRTTAPVDGTTDAADGQLVRVSTVSGVAPFTDYICRRSGGVGTTVFTKVIPDELEVAAIKITDGTGTALDAGSLTLNAAGEVVVHDNESNAEDLPHLVNSRESINFAAVVMAGTMNGATTYSRKLCEIPMTDAEAANGKVISLAGTLRIFAPGTRPDGGVFLVLCRDGDDPKTEGTTYVIGDGTTSEVRNFHIVRLVIDSAGTWTLDPGASGTQAIVTKNNGGTIAHAEGWADFVDANDVAVISGTTGEPFKLEMHLLTVNVSASVSSNVVISGQLSAISQ